MILEVTAFDVTAQDGKGVVGKLTIEKIFFGIGDHVDDVHMNAKRLAVDILDELAMSVTDLEDAMDIFSEQLDAVDEDLDELESFVYEELDDCDCDCDCDCDDEEEYYDVECPSCGEVICVDRDILEEGSINCPQCNELLEFEVECDCDCDDCED
jgi:hypothetical protein